jgi:hypothetical protein
MIHGFLRVRNRLRCGNQSLRHDRRVRIDLSPSRCEPLVRLTDFPLAVAERSRTCSFSTSASFFLSAPLLCLPQIKSQNCSSSSGIVSGKNCTARKRLSFCLLNTTAWQDCLIVCPRRPFRYDHNWPFTNCQRRYPHKKGSADLQQSSLPPRRWLVHLNGEAPDAGLGKA